MPQAVLHQRQHVTILAAFREDDVAGRQSRLLETGGVQIEPADHPEHARTGGCRKPGGNPCGEEGRRRLVVERRRGGCRFVQGRAVQSAVGKAGIDLVQQKRNGCGGTRTRVCDRVPLVR